MRVFVHDDFWTHWKLQRAALRLKMDQTHVGGAIVRLWCWTMRYRSDGDLTGLKDEEISLASGLFDTPDFAPALRESGFIDDANCIHDWLYWQGTLLAKVNRDRVTRARRARRANVARKSPPTPLSTPTPTSEKLMSPPGTPFLKFWTLWPSHKRKKGRPQCEKKWAGLDETTRQVIIDKLPSFVKSWDWTKEDREYMPGPVPWLNAAGWEAEAGAETAAVVASEKPTGAWATKEWVRGQ